MKPVRIASWSRVLPAKTRLMECAPGAVNRLSELGTSFIPRGSGRSLGDAAYLTGGVTLLSRRLCGISEFDAERGAILCESGVQLIDLFRFLEGSGWTVPVGGGTRWVTVGGAVAADIHGKNDVRLGSFGNHVERLQLTLASGEEVECSTRVRPELFAATVGGMGLTGFITHVRLRLFRGLSSAVHARTSRFSTVEEMLAGFRQGSDFQVAWIDLTTHRWRGIYHAASYVEGRVEDRYAPFELRVPPVKLFNRQTVRWLNAARYRQQDHVDRITHVMNVHYPVDLLKHWNNLYGPRGFQEYQFVVSAEALPQAFTAFIEGIHRFGLAPFFVVVKQFGAMSREGLLSFPKAGFTVMADFEHRPEHQRFFEYFTDLLLEMGGRTYLAKDSYTLPRQFERMYDGIGRWRDVVRQADPANRIQSNLSTRLGMKPW